MWPDGKMMSEIFGQLWKIALCHEIFAKVGSKCSKVLN